MRHPANRWAFYSHAQDSLMGPAVGAEFLPVGHLRPPCAPGSTNALIPTPSCPRHLSAKAPLGFQIGLSISSIAARSTHQGISAWPASIRCAVRTSQLAMAAMVGIGFDHNLSATFANFGLRDNFVASRQDCPSISVARNAAIDSSARMEQPPQHNATPHHLLNPDPLSPRRGNGTARHIGCLFVRWPGRSWSVSWRAGEGEREDTDRRFAQSRRMGSGRY